MLGRLVARLYGVLPFARLMLRICTRLEGGDMYSETLRRVLRERFSVEVGPYTYGSLLSPGAADRETTIGAYVSIGPGVRRFGASHPLNSPSLHPFWYNARLGFVTREHDVVRLPCTIEADSWIGANVVILPGCQRIGIGAVVGAGAIVTRDVADFEIVAGNPARRIGYRLHPDTRKAVITQRHWDSEPAQAFQIIRAIEIEQQTDAS